MQSSAVTLNCFSTTLTEPSEVALRARMSYYQDKPIEFNRDFHTIKICDNEHLKQIVEDILIALNIPPIQRGRYLGAPLTIYEFLLELAEHNKKENTKLKVFIELIEDQKKQKWKKIFYRSAWALAIIDVLIPFIALLGGFNALHTLFAAALFFPVVGMLFTVGIGIYSYKKSSDPTTSLWERFQNHFFLLAKSTLKFAAYGVLIAAVATTTPVVAILFIAAELVDVVQAVVSFAKMIIEHKKKVVVADDTNIERLQQKARYDSNYIKQRNSVGITLGSALLCSGIVAAWCFAPGGMFVAVGALALIGLIALGEILLKNYNKKMARISLQNKFAAIETHYETTTASQLESDLSEGRRLEPTKNVVTIEREMDDRLSQTSQPVSFFQRKQSMARREVDDFEAPNEFQLMNTRV